MTTKRFQNKMNPQRLNWQCSSTYCLSPDIIITDISELCILDFYNVVDEIRLRVELGIHCSSPQKSKCPDLESVVSGPVCVFTKCPLCGEDEHFCGTFSKVLWLWGMLRWWRRSGEAKIAILSHDNVIIFICSKYWIWLFGCSVLSIRLFFVLPLCPQGSQSLGGQRKKGLEVSRVKENARSVGHLCSEGRHHHTSKKAEERDFGEIQSHSCSFVLTHWPIRSPWKKWNLACRRG